MSERGGPVEQGGPMDGAGGAGGVHDYRRVLNTNEKNDTGGQGPSSGQGTDGALRPEGEADLLPVHQNPSRTLALDAGQAGVVAGQDEVLTGELLRPGELQRRQMIEGWKQTLEALRGVDIKWTARGGPEGVRLDVESRDVRYPDP